MLRTPSKQEERIAFLLFMFEPPIEQINYCINSIQIQVTIPSYAWFMRLLESEPEMNFNLQVSHSNNLGGVIVIDDKLHSVHVYHKKYS